MTRIRPVTMSRHQPRGATATIDGKDLRNDLDAWARCDIVEAVEQESLLEVMCTWKALAS